jgi:Predicted membrane protein (DUF2157)
MKNREVLTKLREKNILSEQEYAALDNYERTRPISIHWEIRVLLIAGISMLTGGLGVLIYKNIDTIGHQAIIGLIALAIIGCGWYVLKKRQPFTLETPQKEQPVADNMLLLGCSLFLILEGYLQYQYNIFGTRYGLATLIPTILFFTCAYRFDHIGVLTMAMTAFASWVGLTVTPLSIFKEDVFKHQPTLIHTGIAVGLFLMIAGLLLNYRRIKPHFTFSYLNFGYNLLSIALIYGAFQIDKAFYSLVCLVFSALAIAYARREQSSFFLLAGVIYGYIAFTILISILHFEFEGWLFYGTISCFAVVMFFLNFKKILGIKQ